MAPRRFRFHPAGFLAGLFLAASAVASAAPNAAPELAASDYSRRSWHTDDGLPGEEIVALEQDPKGFLWVATTAGLARFDGSHFEPYAVTDADPQVYTRVLAVAPGLGLVAALPRNGLVRLDHDAFRPVTPAPLPNDAVQAMLVAPGGALWLVGENGSLVCREGKTLTAFEIEKTVPRAGPRSLALDAQGRVWFAGNGYVARYDGGAWVRWPDRFGGAELHLGSSASHGPWLVTKDRILRLEDAGPVEVARIPPLLSAHYVRAITEDRDGDLWVGTRSQGLYVVSGGEVRHVTTSQEEVTSLYCDPDGNIWVGTNGGGLDRVRRKTYRLYDMSTGLLQNLSYSVYADDRGDVWLANRDGGVARVHRGAVETIVVPSSLPALSAISLFRTPDGQVGVTGGTGIFRLPNQRGGELQKIDAIPQVPIVRVTFSARNGDVWFAIDPDRVGRLRENRFDLFGAADGMTGTQVRGIAEDSTGRLWLGTTDGKLFRQVGERFVGVSLDGLRTGAINAIYIEPDDTVWLGTVSAGIVGFVGPHPHSCSLAQGLPDENIVAIVPDNLGHFWCSSKRGIFRIGHQELVDCLAGRAGQLKPLLVGQEDAVRDLPATGGFQPSACRNRDGTLWFATRRGVLAIDPAKATASPVPPPVAIEAVRLNDTRGVLNRPLVLGPQVHKLQVRFGVLSLSAPERVLARYRLEGFDTDWIDAGAGRVATYPRLPAGHYLFAVTARNIDGTDEETHDSLAITVIPPWWETWWFRLAAFSAAALGIAGIVRYWSHRRWIRRLERLERETAIERERTRIAQNIHDDVGASLTRISLLAQHGQHEVAGGSKFFDEIYGTATDITRSLDEIVWAVNPRFDNLESLANYLGNFAQRFLDLARLRCRLEIPDQLPPIPLPSDARHTIFLCFKEALNNVVKHAAATAVRIAVEVSERRLVVSIQDDGRGLEASSADAASHRRLSSGNGLENMRQRMASVGGVCTVSSEPGQGTRVVLSIPLFEFDADTGGVRARSSFRAGPESSSASER